MWYTRIRSTAAGQRTAQRLLALKDALAGDGGVPPKESDTLLLATWNIREFDSPAYGARDWEPLYYIAEIISHFDLVAVQEVREDLYALDQVRRLLGSWWKYIVTDVTEGSKGNRERMAFLYDTRKVSFGTVAGEIVIPPIKKKGPDGKTRVYDPADQLARTPFVCGFRAHWARFMLCTVHILYGKSTRDDPARVAEIRQIAKFLAARGASKSAWSKNIVLLGDFNIFNPNDVTMAQITEAGFTVPPEIQDLPGSNAAKNRHYDQIAFLPREGRLESTGRAGVFDFFETVYRDEDEAIYVEDMGESYFKTKAGKPRDERKRSQYYRTYWRTHQMSDHLPMWVELRIDFGREYLRAKAGFE